MVIKTTTRIFININGDKHCPLIQKWSHIVISSYKFNITNGKVGEHDSHSAVDLSSNCVKILISVHTSVTGNVV